MFLSNMCCKRCHVLCCPHTISNVRVWCGLDLCPEHWNNSPNHALRGKQPSHMHAFSAVGAPRGPSAWLLYPLRSLIGPGLLHQSLHQHTSQGHRASLYASARPSVSRLLPACESRLTSRQSPSPPKMPNRAWACNQIHPIPYVAQLGT